MCAVYPFWHSAIWAKATSSQAFNASSLLPRTPELGCNWLSWISRMLRWSTDSASGLLSLVSLLKEPAGPTAVGGNSTRYTLDHEQLDNQSHRRRHGAGIAEWLCAIVNRQKEATQLNEPSFCGEGAAADFLWNDGQDSCDGPAPRSLEHRQVLPVEWRSEPAGAANQFHTGRLKRLWHRQVRSG